MFEKVIKWMIGNNALATVSVVLTTIIFPFNIYLIKNNQNKTVSYISNIVGFVIALVTIILLIAKSQYTVVPYLYDLSAESAKTRIVDAGLKYDKHDFLDDDDKYIISVIPDSGSVVKKNSTVRVVMVNKYSDFASSGLLNEDEENNDKYKDMILYGINTNHLELVVNDIGAYISTKREKNARDIGHLKLENAKIELIEYFTNKPIMKEYSNKYGLVNFNNIGPGIYYFKASCDGYETTVSDAPFKLVQNDRYEDNPGTWRISLKRKDQQFQEPSFNVKIIDENEKPIIHEELQVRVFHKDYEHTAFHSIKLVSDGEGYLSLRSYDTLNNVTTENLDRVSIQLGLDYEIEFDYNGLCSLVDEVESDEFIICLKE